MLISINLEIREGFIRTTPPSETKPSRCNRPLELLALSKHSTMLGTLGNSPFLMVWSIRTTFARISNSILYTSYRNWQLTSCQTTLPAPIFRCPTSLLPIKPSGNPTANDDASNSVYPWEVVEPFLAKPSITGVLAARIASPSFLDFSVGIPQPSMTTNYAMSVSTILNNNFPELMYLALFCD